MNWKRWIRPGLVATVVVAALAVYLRHGAVEGDIAARVNAALSADGGLGWATATVSARDVTISGTAPSVESQQQAVALAGQVAGVHAVTSASGLLPIASPFVWVARRQGASLALSGSVPSEGARAALLAAARRAIPTAEITDTMALARGAPPSFNAAAAFGLERLAALADGSVSLSDTTLAVSGTAASASAYAGLQTALAAALPAGVTLGPAEVQPARADPFVWSANFDGKALALDGYVPNAVVRETLLAAAHAALPGVPVTDSLAVASGDPPHFAEAAGFAIAALVHLSQGGVTLDGLNLDVSGQAKSVDDYEALLSAISGALPAGLKVVAEALEPAVVSPYGWQGERAGQSVILTGYVPSDENRDEVAAVARVLFSGLNVDDRVRVAAGEPQMDWIGAVKFAMGELAQLSTGKVSVGDKTFSVSGMALSPDAYAALLDANQRTLPASMALADAEITPPRVSPYRFYAERAPDGGVVMSGDVAGAADRDAIFAAAHARFGTAEVSGTLAFGSGAPAGFVDAAGTLLGVLSRLSGGHVAITDQAVSVDGLTYDPGAVAQIADTLSGDLPQGFTVAADTVSARQADQPVTPSACRDLIQQVLQTGAIAFDAAKTEIASTSIGLLDRVAAAIARCPDAVVEVGAHSDNQGSASKNRDKTQARAEAIVEFLVSAGIKRERLSAVGYGESDPIGDNDTEAGRAANERIEFSVTLPDAG